MMRRIWGLLVLLTAVGCETQIEFASRKQRELDLPNKQVRDYIDEQLDLRLDAFEAELATEEVEIVVVFQDPEGNWKTTVQYTASGQRRILDGQYGTVGERFQHLPLPKLVPHVQEVLLERPYPDI